MAEGLICSDARGSDKLGLPPSMPMLPLLLRGAGYRTALVGKWHLGYPPHVGPSQSGYDEFYGALSGGLDYFTHANSRGNHDGREAKDEDGYLTDLLSRRAVEYVCCQANAAEGHKLFSQPALHRVGAGRHVTTQIVRRY